MSLRVVTGHPFIIATVLGPIDQGHFLDDFRMAAYEITYACRRFWRYTDLLSADIMVRIIRIFTL